ncbi:MAG TPA: xanthine dehydrogenase family protein subunit M [Bryobacteraceae bacterium]|nr:xanthine dehydrogenase family protein subunit M [Bryobacteraceae bacterium]
MQAFEYANPTTLQEATGLLSAQWGEAGILAGGTDLISLMKDYVETPKRVVNVKGIKELGGIHKSGAGLRIGSIVTFDELMENAAVRSEYPSLIEAVRGVSSPQIRNMGTVGGDLCQRPRCWYYRGGHGLLAMDASGKSLVPNGENRYHAIFPAAPAYFVSASSLGPALVALGAKVKLVSPSGNREVPIEKFFLVPQNAQGRETALQANEILTEIVVPTSKGAKNATYEVREKDALDWPLATASVALTMKGNSVGSARIVMGHVAPTPHIAAGAEKFLAGKTISESVAEEAGKAAVADAKPLSQNEYKVQLARVAVKRALLHAAGMKA